MTAPSAVTFLTVPGNEWTITLDDTVAANDTFVVNGATITAKASGASTDEFNIVSGNVNATASNLMSAINAHFQGVSLICYDESPAVLALATLANGDEISLNAVGFKAVTSGADHTATPREFNLASDHGAADFAAQVNGLYGAITNVTGTLGAVAASTNVTLTGAIFAYSAPSTVTHAVLTPASNVITVKGGLTSYSYAMNTGDAKLRAICRANLAFYANIQIAGGSADDTVTLAKGICVGVTSTVTSLPVVIAPSQIEATRSLAVPASGSVSTPIGMNLYAWQWDGSTFDYYVSAQLSFSSAGTIFATPAILSLVNPVVT